MKQHQKDARTKRKARQNRKTLRAEVRLIEKASGMKFHPLKGGNRGGMSISITDLFGDGVPLQMPVITGPAGLFFPKSDFELQQVLNGTHPTKRIHEGQVWNVDPDGKLWRLEESSAAKADMERLMSLKSTLRSSGDSLEA